MSRTTAPPRADEQKPIKLEFGSYTSSAGRPKNEDRVEVRQGRLQIAMVADGMGGGVLGAAMSDQAVRVVYEYLESQPFNDPAAQLGQAFDNANQALLKLMGRSVLSANSGSTLVCAVMQRTPAGLIAHLGSVGDTRAYLVQADGKLRQVNRDHSYYEQLIDDGLTPAQARQDRNARKLTFSLGSEFAIRDVPYFYTKQRIQPGESLLLCSDGVSEFVDPADLSRILKGTPADKAAQKIVEKAYANKTSDNASAVVVRYDNSSAFAVPLRRAAQIGGGLLVLGALGFGISSAIGSEGNQVIIGADGQEMTITPLPTELTGRPTSTFAAIDPQATSTRVPTPTPTLIPTNTPVPAVPSTARPTATLRPGQPTQRPQPTARPLPPGQSNPPAQPTAAPPPGQSNPPIEQPTAAPPGNSNPPAQPPTEPPSNPGNPRATNTPRPPANTPLPQATNTPVPPQATDTPVPPQATDTPVPPQATNTPVPPQATNTPVPPQATNTPVPPQATNTPCTMPRPELCI